MPGSWLCLENNGPIEPVGIFTYSCGPWKNGFVDSDAENGAVGLLRATAVV